MSRDTDIRDLERRLEAGDPTAENPLAWARIRAEDSDFAAEIAHAVIRRGEICGWLATWEYPGILALTPPGDFDTWLAATPYWDSEPSFEGGEDPEAVAVEFHGEGGVGHLMDFGLPSVDDVSVVAEVYRQRAARAISLLAGVFLARLSQSCSCGRHFHPLCPTHGEVTEVIQAKINWRGV